MPNRILREGIIESERVNQLSDAAELLYRRLMSKVDDFGRFHGHPALVLAACYPLRLDQVDRISQPIVRALLAECAQAGLITLYTVEGKKYLEIKDFGQRTRTDSKFPAPCAQDVGTMRAQCPQDAGALQARARARSESESESYAESETNAKTDCAPPAAAGVRAPVQPIRQPRSEIQPSERFEEVWERWPRQVGLPQAERDWCQYVNVENEAAVLACVERYLASDEVARGAVRNLGTVAGGGSIKPGWLADCSRDGWQSNWPRARDSPGQRPQKQSTAEAMTDRARELWRQQEADGRI